MKAAMSTAAIGMPRICRIEGKLGVTSGVFDAAKDPHPRTQG